MIIRYSVRTSFLTLLLDISKFRFMMLKICRWFCVRLADRHLFGSIAVVGIVHRYAKYFRHFLYTCAAEQVRLRILMVACKPAVDWHRTMRKLTNRSVLFVPFYLSTSTVLLSLSGIHSFAGAPFMNCEERRYIWILLILYEL